MKKTLMVLTFALCATFVFAQTMTPRVKEQKAMTGVKHAVSQSTIGSSIFTKDSTLLTVTFSDGSATGNVWTGTNYTTGTVTGTSGHGQTYNYTFWQRWTNNDNTDMCTMYPTLAGWFDNDFMSYLVDTTASTAATGFMFLPAIEQRSGNTGTYNAYIEFPVVNASTASVVDVQFYQDYYKYYDKTYMDYSTNNGTSWTAVEINVRGVDMTVNQRVVGVYTYSLPLAAAGQTSLKVRLRFNSIDGYQAYGYWWLVDDVNIVAGPADRLTTYGQEYVEGNYGIIPQGMTINPAWFGQVKNSGSNAQSNLVVELSSCTVSDGNLVAFASNTISTLAAGDDAYAYCDNGGWLFTDSLDYRGWYGYITTHTAHASSTSTALPTATAGDYLLGAKISNSAVEKVYDTMFYTVQGASTDLNGGYRWGHDNGLLTYAPANVWVYGYIQESGVWYVTDDPDDVDFYAPGYRATTRYTTDATIPEGWVIRGVEMVASPANGYYSTGAQISPVLYQDAYDGGSVQFGTVTTGAGVYTVGATDVNDSTIIGRNSNGYRELGEYNTIYIPFPEQPALEANTSYRIGYMIESEAYLAMAQEAHGSYRIASPTRPDQYDTIMYFKNDPTMSQYAHFYAPNVYQNYVMDPLNSDNGGTFAFYADYNPMIRMIVGPALDITRHNLEITCNGEEYGMTYYGGEEACGETLTPAEGSTQTITFAPNEGCIVSELKVDGEVVEVYNEDEDEGDENFIMYETTDGGYIYYYTISDIQGDHTIEVTFEEGDVPPTAIDPVASAVRMNLQPNPATSQVSLNIEGVEGMVNCSIIDMSGRVVYNAEMNAQNAQVINLNSLAKGAYFVRVTNSNFTKVEKLIVR